MPAPDFDTLEEQPASAAPDFESLAEEAAPPAKTIPLDQPIPLSAYEQAQRFPSEFPMGPYGPIVPDRSLAGILPLVQEGLSLPGKAITAVGDIPTRIANIGLSPESPGYVPTMAERAEQGPIVRFPRAGGEGVGAGLLNLLSGTGEALIGTPEAGLTLPLLGGEGTLGKLAGLGFGATQLAEVPSQAMEALRVLQDPNATAAQKAEALGRPGVSAALGAWMTSHGARAESPYAERIRSYQRQLYEQGRKREALQDISGQNLQQEAPRPAEPLGTREEEGRAEILLKSLQPVLDRNKSLGIGHEADIVDNFGDRDVHNLIIAEAGRPEVDANGNLVKPGKITISREALQRWMDETDPADWKSGIESILGEEGIHATITDAEALAYHNSLTAAERAIGQRLYLGKRGSWESIGITPEETPQFLGHELLRQRMQRLLRMDPTEIAEVSGREKWTRASLEVLANIIRGARELVGTKSAKFGGHITDKLLDRYEANLNAALDGVSEPAPAEPELIKHAYFEDDTGETHMGANHPEVLDWLGVKGFETPESRNTPQFGFITNKGRKLTRPQAEELAKANGQDLSPFIGAERPKEAIHADEVLEPGTGKKLGDTEQEVTKFDENNPFAIRRRPEGPPPTDPHEMALAIGPVRFDATIDWKLPGLTPKWQWTLTTPGRETTFMTDAGASFDAVRRKTGIKDLQFERHIGEIEEAERLYDELHPDEPKPKAIRRRKVKEHPELFIPNVPRGTPETTPPGAPPATPTEAPPQAVPRVPTGELSLEEVPKGAPAPERGGFPAPGAGQVEDLAARTLDATVAAGKPPSFDEFAGAIRSQYGATVPRDTIYYAWQDALGAKLLKASGAELDALVDAMGIRGRLQAEHQLSFARGTIAEPVEVPAEHQAQFASISQAFPHKKVPTPRAVRELFGPNQRRRYMAIGAIMDKLGKEAGPRPEKSIARKEVGPEEISWRYGQKQFRQITPGEAVDPEEVGRLATENAAVEATGKGAPPRTVSKNLLAVRDLEKRYHLLSTWRDPRSGPRVTDPANPSGPSRKIDSMFLLEYQPQAVMTLREPVKGFSRVFDDVNAFYKWFGETGIEGTPGIKTSSFAGPEAGTARFQAGISGAGRAPAAEAPARLFELGIGEAMPSETGRELETPGRTRPIPFGRTLYRMPKPEESRVIPEKGVIPSAEAPTWRFPEPMRYGRPTGRILEYGKPGEMGPGWPLRAGLEGTPTGRRTPAAIRRAAQSMADELHAIGKDIASMTVRGATAQRVSSALDASENLANNFSRQVETGIRLQSVTTPTGRVKRWLENWRNGKPEVLSGGNVLVEAGAIRPNYTVDNGKLGRIPIFRQEVMTGIQKAQQMQATGGYRERRVGRAWERSNRELLKELDYAERHWHDPELQATAIRMKQELDEAYNRETAAGAVLTQDPNYLPHRFDAELWDGRSVLFAPLRILGKNFREARTFDTHYEAAAAGPYIPVTRDGASIVAHRVRQGMQQINYRRWQEGLKAIIVDGKPLAIEPIKGTHDRWISPDRNYELVSAGPGTKPIVVQAAYKSLIRNLTSHSPIEDWALTRNTLHMEQRLKHTLLVGDFFHLARVLYYAGSIMGREAGFRGGWSALDVAERDMPDAIRRGLVRQPDADWAAQRIDFTAPGGTRRTITRRELATRYYAEMGANLGKIQDALYKDLVTNLTPTAGPVARGISRVLDPTVGRYNRFLFDKLTRGIMTESAVREFERLHAANPEIHPERLMRDIAKDVNVYFGNLGRQGFLKARWQQDVARMLFLAPQWVEGLARKEATLYSRATGVSQALGRRGLPYLGTTGTGLARGMVFLFGLTQALNYINRGHSTFQNPEKGHFLDAYIKGHGADATGFWFSPLAVFNELTHDLWRLSFSKPKVMDALDQIAGNKESPLVRAALLLRTGRSPTGEIQTTSGAVLSQAAQQLMPLPITFGKYFQAAGHAIAPATVRPPAKGTIPRQLFGTIGIKVEPEATPGQRISELAHDFMTREGLTKESGWQEVMTSDPSYSKLRSAIRNDDAAGAEKLYKSMTKNRSDADVIRAMKEWSKRPFTGSQKTEKQFIQSLDDEQLEEYSRAMERKQMILEKFLDWWQNRP